MVLKSIVIAVAAVALLAAGSVSAGDNPPLIIKGKVIGENKKPMPDAEVRVKALDRHLPDVVVTTDARGEYIVMGLRAGRYSVTAYNDLGIPRSRAIIQTTRKGWAKVNFDLTLEAGDGANRINGHPHFTNPNSHGAIISAVQ